MIRINLLPVKAVQKREMLRGQLIVVVLALALVLVACGGVYSMLLGKMSSEQKMIAAKESEISHLRKSIGEVGRFKKLQKELRGKLEVLDKLKKGRTGPVHLLDELSRSVPEKLWLESFSESNESIALRGTGTDEETVATFLRDLEASPYYRNVELQGVEQRTQGAQKFNTFSVKAQVESPDETSSKK